MSLHCLLLPDSDGGVSSESIHVALRAGCDMVHLMTEDVDIIGLETGVYAGRVCFQSRVDSLFLMDVDLPEHRWQLAAQRMRNRLSGDVLILDQGGHDLRSGDLTRMVAAMRRDDRVMVTVRPLEDHLCQLNEYFDVDEAAVYVRAAVQQDTTALRRILRLGNEDFVSRAFSWDWTPHRARNLDHGLYVLSFDGYRPVLVKVDPGSAQARDAEVLLFRESPDTARQIVFDAAHLAACPMGLLPNQSPLLFELVHEGVRITSRTGIRGLHWLQLVGMSEDSLCSPQSLKLLRFRHENDETNGFLPETGTFLVHVLTPSQLPHADVEWPLVSETGLWKINPKTLVRFNPETGVHYLQRQDMQPAWVMDGRAAALPEQALHVLAAEGWNALNVRGYAGECNHD